MIQLRTCQKNKQEMLYSNILEIVPEYQKDENGNITYIDADGEKIPIPTGTKKPIYSKPVRFTASISSKLNELQMKSWGVDQSAIHSQLIVKKGYLPINIGSVVWRTNKILWEDEEKQIPNGSSADYTCKGLMLEGLHEDYYLLQRNSSEGIVE